MITLKSLIAEFKDATRSDSRERRVASLRCFTDLYLKETDRLSTEQIAVIDDVLMHLTRDSDSELDADGSGDIGCAFGAGRGDDELRRVARVVQEHGEFNDAALPAFARANDHAELAAALAVRCSMPIESNTAIYRSRPPNEYFGFGMVARRQESPTPRRAPCGINGATSVPLP